MAARGHGQFPSVPLYETIGPVKQNYLAQNCDYFLIHWFKHVFWVLKRTVSWIISSVNKGIEEGKDQESMQSSTTPGPGHHMGK